MACIKLIMLSIRKATLRDISTIVELWKEFMRYHDELVINDNPRFAPLLMRKRNAADLFQEFTRTNIQSKDADIFLAEVDGEPAGYCLITIKDNIPIYELERLGIISDLFVKKEFRGIGIGSRLKNEAVNWFKEQGMK